MYASDLLALADARPFVRVHVLSLKAGAHELTRSGPRRLSLQPKDGSFLRSPFEQLYRSPNLPLSVGATVGLGPDGTLHVERMAAAGFPERIALEWPEGPLPCLVLWKDGALRSVAVPALGERVSVQSSPGPFGI
jgi:hypothetical protein